MTPRLDHHLTPTRYHSSTPHYLIHVAEERLVLRAGDQVAAEGERDEVTLHPEAAGVAEGLLAVDGLVH